jgi:tagatose kinase
MGKIVTLGEILAEFMAAEPGQSFRMPGQLAGPFPSGAPAIFIDQVARLGHPAAILGCVGDDDFGWLNIERLRRDGVDTSGIAVLPDAVTATAFVRYEQSGERHFVFNIANSASGRISASLLESPLLQDCTRFHVTGSSLFSSSVADAMIQAVKVVKAKGGSISFDPNIRPELLTSPNLRLALTSVLKYTDVFLPSGDEVNLLVQARSQEAAVAELLASGVSEIVVKRGDQGCSYYDANRRLSVPAVPVREVDPTGAGDCFGATYVTCRSLGMEVERSLRYACASGALAVTRKGGMEGTAGFAELDEMLAASAIGGGVAERAQ